MIKQLVLRTASAKWSKPSHRMVIRYQHTSATTLLVGTSDMSDRLGDDIEYVDGCLLVQFGRKHAFHGYISTVKCHEHDISSIKDILQEDGYNRVLVIDGGGSKRAALFGDKLANKAIENNWSGIIVNGCIRDVAEIELMNIGILALGYMPRKVPENNTSTSQVPVTFGGVTFHPGQYLACDQDGCVVGASNLSNFLLGNLGHEKPTCA